jgi:hypothetical protein
MITMRSKFRSAAFDCHSSILTIGRCRYRVNQCTISELQNSAGTERRTFCYPEAKQLLIEPKIKYMLEEY